MDSSGESAEPNSRPRHSTTDAGSAVPAGWLSQQARHARQGWDAVGFSRYLAELDGATA